jgi:hypothetical protein
MNVLKKLNNTHKVIHLHANNCCGTSIYDNIIVPNIFECTYLRNDLQDFTILSNELIPSSLDTPNIGGLDIILNGYPFNTGAEIVHTYTNYTPLFNFLDFLYGTITLYHYSKKHNYKFKMYIESNKLCELLSLPTTLLTSNHTTPFNLLSNYRDYEIPCILDTMFMSRANIYIKTKYFDNSIDLTDSYNFIKSFIKQNDKIINYIKQINNNIELNKPYTVIYINDENTKINTNLINILNTLIDEIRDTYHIQLIILTNLDYIYTHFKAKGCVLYNQLANKEDIAILNDLVILSSSKIIYSLDNTTSLKYTTLVSNMYAIPIHTLRIE